MSPPRYDAVQPLQFSGALPDPHTYESSAAIVLPIPLDRTTSYLTGTRNGPRELLSASSQVELWDEEVGVDVHGVGVFTLPEMDLSSDSLEAALALVGRVAGEILDAKKFLVALGGEHSITAPIVEAVAARHRDVTVLQIDAHADLRESYQNQRLSHACAMRRTLEHARAVQVGIRNISAEEIEVLPSLPTSIFYDWNMRDDPAWMSRVLGALSETVYITIDLDGFEPGLMPAVGTPEPGGLSWREATALLRRVFEEKTVVACDVVELCPIPGMAAPNFVAARLVYKLLTYRFGLRR